MFEQATYIETLQAEFEKEQNLLKSLEQKAYLKNQFEFYGLSSPERRLVQKPFLVKAYLPPKAALQDLVTELWNKPQREFQYFAEELVFKYHKEIEQQDIALLEYMITHKSWWDTVDFIATKPVGAYFKQYPELKKQYVEKWINSKNMWLQRTALIFQLKYKTELDTELLSYAINNLLGSKEFFINKAIGWILREYTRTNADWVTAFVEKADLSNLSKKEALRLIK